MTLTMFSGYPDKIGKRFAFTANAVGPTSYSQTTKDVVTLPGYQNYIDSIHASLTVSGTYLLRAQPSLAGARAAWKFTWVVVATGVEVAGATNLSAEKVIVSGFGGQY